MAREKVTFEKPVQVLLDKAEGKEVESRDGGIEYMRVLDNDQRIMFAPQALEASIQASGATAGDLIQIERKKSGRGWIWDVAILTEEPPARQQARPATRQAAPPARTAAKPAAQPHEGEITAETVAMTTAFMAAIQASREAEDYAGRNGLRDFQLSTAEIKSLAITIYIQRAKGGR